MSDSRELTYSEAFREGVAEEMEHDPTIFVLGTDLYLRGGHFAQFKGIGERFGSSRIRDTPISESAIVAAGVGAALNGCRPIVDLNFADFALGAMDEIVNQAAKMRYMWGAPVPLVIRATAGVAMMGAQHNNSLEAIFAHIPGLVVVMPSNPADAKGLVKSAIRRDDPVLFLMHKRLTGRRALVPEDQGSVPIGKGTLVRSGVHLSILTYGALVQASAEAAATLASEGLSVEVIDLRTLYPLDEELIARTVRKTGRVLVASEAPVFCSVASELAALIQERHFFSLDQPVVRLAPPRAPVPHSPALLRALVPSVADIARAARELAAGDAEAGPAEEVVAR